MRRFERQGCAGQRRRGFGIGSATVARLAADRATVWEFVLPGLEGPTGCAALEVDVTVEAHWTAALDTIIETSGSIDVLVNSAGILVTGRAVGISLDQWHRVLDVNITGVFLSCRAAVPHKQSQFFRSHREHQTPSRAYGSSSE